MNEQLDKLIEIEQLPVVAANFAAMIKPVEERVQELLSMDCTEETKKHVKEERANLRSFRNALSDAARAKKKIILAPWEQVEEQVKKITSICDDADNQLRDKISQVEEGQKREKEIFFADYFREKSASAGVEWLNIESVGTKVGLSITKKKLQEAVDELVNRVSADVACIQTLDDAAEILAEYKACLSLPQSMDTVKRRREAVEAEERRIQEERAAAEAEERRIREMESMTESSDSFTPPVSAPVAVSSPVESVTDDCESETKEQEEEHKEVENDAQKDAGEPQDDAQEEEVQMYRTTVTVRGTKDQLMGLKQYIVDNDIEIVRE